LPQYVLTSTILCSPGYLSMKGKQVLCVADLTHRILVAIYSHE
jgi:hypothetical protein